MHSGKKFEQNDQLKIEYQYFTLLNVYTLQKAYIINKK